VCFLAFSVIVIVIVIINLLAPLPLPPHLLLSQQARESFVVRLRRDHRRRRLPDRLEERRGRGAASCASLARRLSLAGLRRGDALDAGVWRGTMAWAPGFGRGGARWVRLGRADAGRAGGRGLGGRWHGGALGVRSGGGRRGAAIACGGRAGGRAEVLAGVLVGDEGVAVAAVLAARAGHRVGDVGGWRWWYRSADIGLVGAGGEVVAVTRRAWWHACTTGGRVGSVVSMLRSGGIRGVVVVGREPWFDTALVEAG
jgi:hypothetical protein